MCTVTILRDSERLLVTMNRDEQWGRAAELPPTAHPLADGGAWLGPADGERGGTWIGASSHGVVGCLLNGYSPEDLELLGRADVPSRGELVPALLEQPPERALAWLENGLDPTPFPSFTLLALTLGSAVQASWRPGGPLECRPLAAGWEMVSSSFWRTAEVLPWRRAQFEAWRAAGAELRDGVPTFNLLVEPGLEEWSPLVTRPMSATRSVTQVDLRPAGGELQMRYWRRSGADPIRSDRVTAAARLAADAAGGSRPA